MPTLQEQMEAQGLLTPSTATPPPPVEEEAPRPFGEISPGLFFDAKKAKEEYGFSLPKTDGFFDGFKKFITGEFAGQQLPPGSLSVSGKTLNPLRIPFVDDKLQELMPDIDIMDSDETVAAKERSAQEFAVATFDRMQPKAQEFGVNFAPDSNVVSELIQEKTPSGIFAGQSQLYLADTDEQYMNAMENIFGEGNVRIIKDDGPKPSLFSPTNYISVKDDNGNFTDFAPASTNFKDYAERVAPGLIAEVGAATAIVPAAFATGAVFGAVPFAGVVLGPLAFVYTLYVGGKSVELGRQYIQDTLGLNDEEAVAFSGVLDATYKMLVPQIEGATTDQRTPAETQREIAASLEVAFAAVPALKNKMKIAIGRLHGREDVGQLFESGVRAQETAIKSDLGGEFDIGVPLESLMLQQVTPNRIIGRLSSLAEQTSLVIPAKTRAQMQSVVEYLQKYGDDVGAGDFEKFRSNIESIGTTLQSVKNAPDAENVIPDLSTIGENLNTLDDLFLRLRAVEARGLYGDVFSRLKNSSYDLENLRELLPERVRTIIPTTPPDATARDAVTGAVPPQKRGERLVDDLVNDLMSLGKVQKDGTRAFNPAQVRAAVKDFSEKNPGFEFDASKVNSPAEILQLYATRFGELARDTFSTSGTAPDPKQFGQAMELRNALLELIGTPKVPVEGVAEDLATANAFYKDTFKLSSQDLQVQARNARRSSVSGEPAVLPEAIATTPSAAARTQPATLTMENINAQEAYIRNNLGDDIPEDSLAATQLKEYFANVLASKLTRVLPTDPADIVGANEVVKFLDSFEPRQLRALGIDETTEAQIRNDAALVAKLQQGGVTEQVIAAPRGAQIAETFETVLGGDSAQIRSGFNEILSTVRRAGDATAQKEVTEELRAGLLNHIFSVDKGIFKRIDIPTPYGDAGELTIDTKKFGQLLTTLNRVNAFETILTAQDKKVLEAMSEYASVINPAGADAGSALAGAQIIGEMFTVDPKKFISGLARLGSQSRIAKLLANDEFVKLATGTGKKMTTAEKYRTMFFGSGSMGSIIARVAMEGSDARDVNEQTEEAFGVQSMTPFEQQLELFMQNQP